MRANELAEEFRLLASAIDAADCSVSTGLRNDFAFIEISALPAKPVRRAAIWSPGDRWVSMDIDDGYSWDFFEEGISDPEMRNLGARLVRLASAYCSGTVELANSRTVWRGKILTVWHDGTEYEFSRSLAQRLKSPFRS